MKNLAILCTIIVISSSCNGQKKKFTYSNITVNHIEFDDITYTIYKKTQDTLQIEGVLKRKAIIDDIPCYGNVTFTKGWELKKFTLAEDHVFAGNNFPEDTYIEMGIDLNLQSDIGSLENYFAIRGARYQIINKCVFASNQLINGISCHAGEGVFFRPNWNLISCILADDDTIAGNVLPKGTFIRFDHDGMICCFCLVDPHIQGYECSGTDYTHWTWMGGGGVFLYPNGRLQYFQPVEDIEIQGVFCKPSSVRGGIYLYENGRLKKCTSAMDQTIDGVFCGKNFTLKFDENGTLIYAKKEKIFD
jgi:hypothetical protein